MAPRPGGWAAGGGGGWKYHLSLPSRPFLQLGPLKKPPLASSSRVPGQSLSPRGLFHDPGNTNPGALPPCAPLSASPGVPSRLPAPRVSPSPRLGPESRKTRSLPPDPPSPRRPPPGCPDQLWPSASARLLEGRGQMPTRPPPLGPLPARGSGFTHGCPELLRAARAGSRRSRLARPSPAPRGRKGGRPGRGLSARTLLGPGPRPPFSASPWPLRLPPKPLVAPAVVFSPVRSGDGSARSFCTQLERSFWLSTRWGSAG